MNKFKSAVILAGGKSSRMKFDKQFLNIKGVRLIDSLIDKLKSEFEEIIIVTNKKEFYKDYKVKIVSDEIKGKGPLSGIHVGLKEASSEYVYFIACDMPIVNLEYITYMKSIIKDVDACVTKSQNHIEPLNSFYNKRIINKIDEYLCNDRRSLFSFINNINTMYVEEDKAREFSHNWDMFKNLNTQEDLIIDNELSL
ncbi:molybdenum cofactor guanylyltransferase [Tepidibacter hydrothermalis]|uniref:Probable molybdenum cofactor guanylyltransferase n=1 Tax=Tepidibacter hydrothermalis TaxID=3036126 RepID=A0ABY8EGN0_9FIRM|nr:molybdenum cofactor guanylyltransferase [Tepidibacter hydrothermalis]WFD10744.1 molybdenum cofactor guanylyltransferase [Tepidibacter hydrothermalis]